MGLGEQGKGGINFKGTWELSLTFEGNKQTTKMFGNMDHRKTNFRIWRTGELVSKFVSGDHVPLKPPPPPI